MKLKNVFFTLLCFVLAISFNSCKKDNNSNSTTTTDPNTEAQTQSNDQVMYTNESDAATDDVNAAIDVNGGSYNARTTGINTFPFTLACDATVTVDTTSTPRTITITYSGNNCSGTRTRSGSVVASFSPDFKWGSAGAQVTITFNNLKITYVKDGKSVVINGTRTLTNTTGGLLRNLASLDSVVHTINDANMSVTFDNGTKRTWQNSSKRVFTYNDGAVITITGSGSGVNRYGHNFSTLITAPLVIKQSCDFRYTSGQVHFTGAVVTTTTTFGLDATGLAVSSCPLVLYYKIVWTGSQGTSLSYIGNY